MRKKRKILRVLPPPTASNSDSSAPLVYPTHSVEMFTELIRDLEEKFDKAAHNAGDKNALKELFTCLICQQISTEASRPVVPPCCQIVCSFDCIQQCISSSPVYPHSRSPVSTDACLVLPLGQRTEPPRKVHHRLSRACKSGPRFPHNQHGDLQRHLLAPGRWDIGLPPLTCVFPASPLGIA